jgi:hypothetical protein
MVNIKIFSVMASAYDTWDRRGNIVIPACPPTTGTLTSLGSTPSTSALKKQQRRKVNHQESSKMRSYTIL